VPIIAVPITYEQPAIAARVEWSGVGQSIPLNRLTGPRLRNQIQELLRNPAYAMRARNMATACHAAGGVERAASVTEEMAILSRNRS